MSPLPTWLPELFPTDGHEEDAVIEGLHEVFRQDFMVESPTFRTLPVWWDRRVGARGYHEAFWHIITKGEIMPRQFDPRRAERLPWCGPQYPGATRFVISFGTTKRAMAQFARTSGIEMENT